MNIELENKLRELVSHGQLDQAISIAEEELSQHVKTDFHKVIGINLLHLVDELNAYIEYFYTTLASKTTIKAMYAEMNGFTINYDLWFISLFAFEKYEDLEDKDWLGDYDVMYDHYFSISGFEELQAAYENYMKNEDWEDEENEAVADICELIIILRLQELFKAAKEAALKKGLSWGNIPLFVTAHDSELLCKV
ncbi:hypothetical protein GR160_07760 [Flavobacterium sp. Sd200]|uniref:hypothetical protein n=1 Tax=Flavobacterium sp. Sd200 TaxID=2692211 RepID=UPI001369E6F0|nr:hypothetical protein [Flavobacterium sp. Sd200]MXN91124.1 hypothetical protein [Flavobacterium sp. Sd200]